MQQSALNILVIEDNPGDFILVNEYLEESFSKAKIFHSATLRNGIDIIKKENIDVILLDLTLPDGMGTNTFLSAYKQAKQIPIIVLSGVGDTDTALESLKFGAQDFIMKDEVTSTVLGKSIKYSIERSKIRGELKKSEEQYKYLFHNNPLPMLAYENNTQKFLMVNEAAVLHYGYDEEEFLQMHLTDLQIPLSSADHLKTLFHGIDNIKTNSPDIQHKKKNGEIIEVEIGLHDIIIEGKNACLSVIHDVTEKNKAKEQLRESEEMFRTISENFPNGAVAILDRNLTISYMAGKELPVKNTEASLFENTVYTSHFDSSVKEQVESNLLKVFEGDNAVFEASSNDLFYIISAVPLKEAGGATNKILIASQNITQQKRIESEKELLIEELKQNNSDLKQFSYITSHNLRSPLSNLLSIIKLVDHNSITDPVTTLLLKNFEDCTLQLNDTVNDLINILIIKNNVTATKERLDLRTIFNRVIHSVQGIVENNNMTITTDFGDAYEVDFNKSYLESILLNLVTNSIKYSSPNRTPHISIKTENIPNGVKLYFTDNGLGIDLNKYKERIFGLYQRFHDHADSKGLGLYIVNSQIRVMGGGIEVESEVDKGTTFTITFKNNLSC